MKSIIERREGTACATACENADLFRQQLQRLAQIQHSYEHDLLSIDERAALLAERDKILDPWLA